MTRIWLLSHGHQVLKYEPWLFLFFNFLPKKQKRVQHPTCRDPSPLGNLESSAIPELAMSSLSTHTGTTLSSSQHQAELNPRCSQARFNRAEPSSCDLFLRNYIGSQRSLLSSEGPGLTLQGWVSHLRASALSHRDQGRQAAEGPSPQRQRPCSLGWGTSLPGSPIPAWVHMSSCPTCTCAHKGTLPGMYPNTHVQTHTDSGTPLLD